MKIAIVGAGVIGTSLGMLLQRAGHMLVAVCSRTKRRANAAAAHLAGTEIVGDPGLAAMGADVVLLAVPDREIEGVAERVLAGGALRRGAVVAHLAGGLASSILSTVRSAGAVCGALHPLQTFADVDTAVRMLPESWFFLEGDEPAVETLTTLVGSIGARAVRIPPETKALYHAGAVMASNFVVVLVDQAVRLLTRAGVPAEDALPALLPLLRGTLKNLETLGLPGALTGPIARGDLPTVQDHLTSLRGAGGDGLTLYVRLARATVDLARRKGTLDAAQAERILDALRAAERSG